jgi:ArsR family transcriptional regulator, arsenate/arsenite/antimonite-responsive transcriptional repressor
MDTQTAVDAFAALAQPSRLAVVRLLVEAAPDGALPGEIAEHLGIPANTLSFHLKTLSHAGLVSAEQNGRHIRYRADTGLVRSLVAFLTENCCGGSGRRCVGSVATARPRRRGQS